MSKYLITCVRTITYTRTVEADNEIDAVDAVRGTPYEEWDVLDDTSYIEDDCPECD